MIEPQNTMLPIPADSAPAEVPHGDSGFGAMLAQTLGMVPELDPNAVAAIPGGSPEQGDDAADLPDGATPQHRGTDPGGSSPRPVAIPMPDGAIGLTAPIIPARPVVGEGGVVDLVRPDSPVPAPPVLGPETVPPTAAPASAAPQAAATLPVIGPESSSPPQGDDASSGPGGIVADPAGPAPPATSATTPVVISPRPNPAGSEPGSGTAPLPLPDQAPIESPAGSGPSPAAPDDTPLVPVATDTAAPVANPKLPTRSAVDPVPPIWDRGLPTPPNPTAAEPVPTQISPAQHLAAPGEPPAILNPADQVHLTESGARLDTVRRVSLGEPNVAVESGATTLGRGIPIATTDTAPAPAAPTTPVGTPAAPVQHSTLAERVVRAVELQANQPPPRTMVVDIPEIEGLRLVVSVRAGAEVHVVPATASTAGDGLQPFFEELEGVLESRGFVMTGDGRRRGANPNLEDDQETRQNRRPRFRRPEPADNDLRI